MKDFKRRGFGGQRSGGFSGRGDGQGFRGGKSKKDFSDRPARSFGDQAYSTTKFKATCADCGAGCQLPFKPSGERPVYCSDCFKNKDSDRSSQSPKRRFQDNYEENAARPYVRPSVSSGVSSEALLDLGSKLDEIISLLKAWPRTSVPVVDLVASNKKKLPDKKIKRKVAGVRKK